jgi:multidrug transporter EmrE-like cation transporter
VRGYKNFIPAFNNIATVFESFGDILLKKWAVENNGLIFFAGVAVYIAAIVVWAVSLKGEYLSKAISLVTILNLIIVVLVGVFFFKEDLSLLNKLGIVIGIVSIILLEM